MVWEQFADTQSRMSLIHGTTPTIVHVQYDSDPALMQCVAAVYHWHCSDRISAVHVQSSSMWSADCNLKCSGTPGMMTSLTTLLSTVTVVTNSTMYIHANLQLDSSSVYMIQEHYY